MFYIPGLEQGNNSTFILDHLPLFRFEHLKPSVSSFVTDSTEMVQLGGLTAQRHLVVLAVAILCFSLCLFPCISSIPRRQ